MTPDKRLDQIEPVMADVLQKVDRLIEGQGQLVEFAVNTKAELEEVKATINDHVLPTLDTLAQQMNGHVIPTLDNYVVPTLATLTQQMDGHVIPTLGTLTQQMNGHVIPTLDQVKTAGEITATGLAKLTVTVNDFQDEMRQRFERNDQTQQEILTILRSRL